jgi:hypothetical protein
VLSAGIAIGIYLIGTVFAAGRAISRAESLKKDVNGVGARIKALEKEASDRHNRMCMSLLAIALDAPTSIVVQLLTGEK